jgi:hypothetical protein
MKRRTPTQEMRFGNSLIVRWPLIASIATFALKGALKIRRFLDMLAAPEKNGSFHSPF